MLSKQNDQKILEVKCSSIKIVLSVKEQTIALQEGKKQQIKLEINPT